MKNRVALQGQQCQLMLAEAITPEEGRSQFRT